MKYYDDENEYDDEYDYDGDDDDNDGTDNESMDEYDRPLMQVWVWCRHW